MRRCGMRFERRDKGENRTGQEADFINRRTRGSRGRRLKGTDCLPEIGDGPAWQWLRILAASGCTSFLMPRRKMEACTAPTMGARAGKKPRRTNVLRDFGT